MSPRSREIVPASEVEVLDDDGNEVNPLDPCPSCGARPHEAPEGVDLAGNPHWYANYCFRCGYRPDATNVNPLTQRWNDFQRFQEQNLGQHPTLMAPETAGEVEALRDGLERMREELAAIREGREPNYGDGSGSGEVE